jgi:transcriptional regulator with XRE-family HTH domain
MNRRTFLKQTRLNLNLSQREVEESLHLKPKYMSNIENGRRDPSYKVTIRLAELYGVNVREVKELFQKDDENDI